MGGKCIGIDVGGTTVKIGVFQVTGDLLFKWEVPTRKDEGGKYINPDISESIRKTLKERNISMDEITGAGMGVPGPVMPDGYVAVCVNLGWRDRNPAGELSSLLGGLPVKSANDANVAALGEMWQGGGKGHDDIVMVTLGTGVGGGVIVDQKIIAGRHGLGGEIGHMHIRDEETERCNCGGVGCVEQIASATGIVREAKRKLAASRAPSAMRERGDGLTARDVLDSAKKGDGLAVETMETVGRYLGLVLAQVSMVVDPEVIVIGGGVSKAGEYLIDLIKRYYDGFTCISDLKSGIVLATLGNDAGIYGAARLILD